MAAVRGLRLFSASCARGSVPMFWTMRRKHLHEERCQIACLACGEKRRACGAETDECPSCHYVGWTYADALDGSTLRLIMNGALAHRRQPGRLRAVR
jgi:hypothetical protein